MMTNVSLIFVLALLPLLANAEPMRVRNRPENATLNSLSGEVRSSHHEAEVSTQTGSELQEIIDEFVVVRDQSPTTTHLSNLSESSRAELARPVSFASTAVAISGRTVPHETRNELLDYVADDNEYEELLRRLAFEAENSIAANRANFVPDDADIETIIRNLESEQTSATSPSTEHLQSTVGPDSSSNDSSEDKQCPICYEPFGDEQVFTTYCSHKFHQAGREHMI